MTAAVGGPDPRTDVPAWTDVVTEITRSCERRAPSGALLDLPGAVGVLAGAAPIVWVHGHAPMRPVLDALRGAPDVRELYVSLRQPEAVEELVGAGWRRDDVSFHHARASNHLRDASSPVPVRLRTLEPGDVSAYRAALVAWGDLEPEIAAAAYPDDFHVVAAPATLLGAVDAAGRLLGGIGLRRQVSAAMLFGLCVDPAVRGQGIAAALVDAAVRHAAAEGAELVHAQSRRSDLCRTGFTCVGGWQRLLRPEALAA